MFQSFPEFRDVFGLQNIGTTENPIIPRMCNWRSKGNPSYDKIIAILDIQWVNVFHYFDLDNEKFILFLYFINEVFIVFELAE